jgi:hypothetical protein
MTDSVNVEQCDREAAYGAYFECYEDTPNDLWLEALRAGKHDDDPQVQLLARHRIAERERCAKIVEARVEPSWHLAAKNAAYVIARAIREPKP